MNSIRYLLFLIIAVLLSSLSVKSQNIGADTLFTNDLIPKSTLDESGICAWIPNIFTPNRDGHLDEWCIKTTGATDGHLLLKNRWGVTIKDENFTIEENITKCLWDNGIGSGGTQSSPGWYFYVITLTNENTGQQKCYTGSVCLYPCL
ncbi:MAG: gliding motility-associated C-terminal domain-containing protein [Bacteroidales bacterium]|nr:gliding motility-associated C-terminal domain-containing protein [Bacteroidales bacterium]